MATTHGSSASPDARSSARCTEVSAQPERSAAWADCGDTVSPPAGPPSSSAADGVTASTSTVERRGVPCFKATSFASRSTT
eukprot:366227-Chlamydomonas_euryale.AAC.11